MTSDVTFDPYVKKRKIFDFYKRTERKLANLFFISVEYVNLLRFRTIFECKIFISIVSVYFWCIYETVRKFSNLIYSTEIKSIWQVFSSWNFYEKKLVWKLTFIRALLQENLCYFCVKFTHLFQDQKTQILADIYSLYIYIAAQRLCIFSYNQKYYTTIHIHWNVYWQQYVRIFV